MDLLRQIENVNDVMLLLLFDVTVEQQQSTVLTRIYNVLRLGVVRITRECNKCYKFLYLFKYENFLIASHGLKVRMKYVHILK